MEAKITKDFELFNDVMTEDYQENIQEFVSSFAEKFQINWTRDITLKLSAKHNKDGMNLIINFKSQHVHEEDPNQLKLFGDNGESKKSNEKMKEKVAKEPAF